MYQPASKEEAQFLKEYDASKYPKPSIAADVALYAYEKATNKIELLLIRRGGFPFRGKFAFPGGFMNMGETAEAAAKRELLEETGLSGVAASLFLLMSDPGRDPRDRVVSPQYLAFLRKEWVRPQAGDDADEAKWFAISGYESRMETRKDGYAQILSLSLSHGEICFSPKLERRIRFSKGGKNVEERLLENGGLAFDHGKTAILSFAALRQQLLQTDLACAVLGREFEKEDALALFRAAGIQNAPHCQRLANGKYSFPPEEIGGTSK